MSTSPYSTIHQKIQKWYQHYGRLTLPWRNTNNPYKIYLSEIMLQQTQVKTVLERFYSPFLEKFPTLQAVAEAPLDDVLKAWEGLGYYTRARNLHKTAQATKGLLPNSAFELEKLSGIGKSTAHAIACFSFGEAVPILDANVKRILHRFFVIEKRDEKLLWKKAYELFDKDNAYIYNQALMDIGSLICTHKKPLCPTCPLQSQCQGKETPLLYPEKKVKKAKPTKRCFMVIYFYQDRYALQKNSTKLLGALWGFHQKEDFTPTKDTTLLGSITQHYSHFKLEAQVLLLKDGSQKKMSYLIIEEIHTLALSGADRKALELLENHLK